MQNIAVFFGGQSVEHDVSVITGVLTLNSIDKFRYNPVPVYVDKSGNWWSGEELFDLDDYKNLNFKKLTSVLIKSGDNCLYAVKGKGKRLKPLYAISCAINCMHGERGEDGSLAGVLAMSAIPLASPSMAASSVCMNKTLTKIFLKGLKINCLKSVTLSSPAEYRLVENAFPYPVIVKPECGGSSIGVKRAADAKELEGAISFALRYGERVIVEPCLTDFTEINCACYRKSDKSACSSACEQPVGRNEILTFNDKYVGGDRVFPANIDEKLAYKIKDTTLRIYNALQMDGVIRIDYFIVDGKVFVNEINTVPGSLAHYLFCDTLKEFSALLNDMLTLAKKRAAANETVQKTYSTQLLTFGGAGGIKGAKSKGKK